MTQLLSLGIYAVKVPDDAFNFVFDAIEDVYWFDYKRPNNFKKSTEMPFDCEILGTVKNSVIDFDCEGIVETDTDGSTNKCYVNYPDRNMVMYTAKISFLSLLQANNLDLKDSYVILKEK